jgi:CheY-like chemotaxis protein
LKPKTVILIDDDPDDLEIMKEALAKVDSNILCISFIYADEAIQLLINKLLFPPDFIFIDLNMPRLAGGEALNLLKKIEHLEKVAKIMYSTSMPKRISDQFLLNGADYTFQKPYKLEDYVSILEGIIFNTGSGNENINSRKSM